MNLRTVAGVFLLLVAGPRLLAQEGSLKPMLEGQSIASWSPDLHDPRVAVLTGLEAQFGGLGARGLAGLVSTEGQVRPGLEEAWTEAKGDHWQLRTGWWPDSSGPGILHSLIPTVSASAPSESLATGGSVVPRSAAKVMVRWFGEEGSLTLEWAPRPPLPELPDAGSWWLPRAALPTTFNFLGTTTPLGALRFVQNPSASTASAWRLSGTWELPWSTWQVVLYRGPDSEVLYPQRFQPATDAHAVELQALRADVSQAWLGVQLPWGPASLWMETCYTDGRLRTLSGWEQDPDAPTFLRVPTGSEAVVEGLGGLSWSTPFPDGTVLRAWGEAQAGRALDASAAWLSGYRYGWTAGGRWEWPREAGSVDWTIGGPWDPQEGWTWLKVSIPGVAGQTLWMGIPWFWGSSTSDWGQFADRRSWAAGTNWKL